MSQFHDRRAASVLGSVLSQCSALLFPKLRRLLNPNVIDAQVRLQLHFANGSLNHLRDADSIPSYVSALKESGEDNPVVAQVVKLCLVTIRERIESRLPEGCHGVVILHVAISGGEATISSEADWVHKPS